MDILNMRRMLSQGKSIYDMPLKVTYYARVSTEREEQLNSLDSQVLYFEDLIKNQPNWTFVPGYVDEGITGVLVKKRESFLRMIRDAKFGCFDLVLTKEVSRFARNTLDSIQYTRDLLNHGVGVHFISDNINTCDPDAELRLTIMSSLAQEEIRKLSDRVRFGYEQSVKKGVVAGSNNILGYKKDNGKLVIVEEEAEIIKKIYELYTADGIGTTKLSYLLYNKYGYTNGKGNPIHAANIRDIIRNPKYKGYYCAHKTTSLDFKTKQRKFNNKNDWVMYKDFEKVPPIVSEEMWEEANKKLEARGNKYSNDDKSVYVQRFPMSQKLFCAHDGCCYTRGNWKKKNGKTIFWQCTCYRQLGKPRSESCNSFNLHETELASAFKPLVREIINSKDEIIKNISDLLNKNVNKTDYSKEKNKLQKEIENIKQQKDTLFDMRSNNEISSEEFVSYKSKYNEKLKQIESKFIELEKKERNVISDSNTVDDLVDRLNKIIDVDDDSILEIASSLFDKIIVEAIRNGSNEHEVKLHCQLKLLGNEKKSIKLSNFFPILRSDARICSTIW